MSSFWGCLRIVIQLPQIVVVIPKFMDRQIIALVGDHQPRDYHKKPHHLRHGRALRGLLCTFTNAKPLLRHDFLFFD